jgi:hypothetical protein
MEYRSAIFILVKPVFNLEIQLGNCTKTRLYLQKILYPYVYSYLLEHGLKVDGRVDPDSKVGGQNGEDKGSYDTFFTETGSGKYVPRSIFVDLDPSVGPNRFALVSI